MEEIKSPEPKDPAQNSAIDFELDAMDFAIKGLPSQNKNLPFETIPTGSLDEKIKTPPPVKEEEETIKMDNSVHPSVSEPSVLKSSLNKFPAPNPIQKPASQKNLPFLTIILSIIVLAGLAGGAFYYFQYFAKNKDSSITEAPLPTPTIQPTENPTVTPPKIITPFSAQTEELILSSESLLEKIASLKQASIDNPALKETLTAGVFYQIKKTDQILSAQEILQAIEVPLPIETASMLQKGWLFVQVNEASILKTALVFSVDNEKYNNSAILNLEKDLPILLKNLFVEEESVVQETEIVFQSNSQETRLRYFNFKKDDPSRTTDWAKIGDYLFFTTSKNSAFKIISLLEPN